MDIYCRTCGEPWDMDTLHDEIEARIAIGDLAPLPDNGNYSGPQYHAYREAYDRHYAAVRSDFYRRGCKAMYAFSGGEPSWCKPKEKPANGRLSKADAMDALIDVLGDDLDGIASMMEDAKYLGIVE